MISQGPRHSSSSLDHYQNNRPSESSRPSQYTQMDLQQNDRQREQYQNSRPSQYSQMDLQENNRPHQQYESSRPSQHNEMASYERDGPKNQYQNSRPSQYNTMDSEMNHYRNTGHYESSLESAEQLPPSMRLVGKKVVF